MSTVGTVPKVVQFVVGKGKADQKEIVEQDEATQSEGVLTKSARSLTGDVFSLLSMNAAFAIPAGAGKFFGLPIGIMKGVEGFVQLSEGMIRQDKHEVIDGAFNMFIGGAITATSMLPFFYLPYAYSGVGTGLVLAKMVYDNPKTLLLEEPKNLVCNTGYAIGQGAKSIGQSIWNGIKKPFTG